MKRFSLKTIFIKLNNLYENFSEKLV